MTTTIDPAAAHFTPNAPTSVYFNSNAVKHEQSYPNLVQPSTYPTNGYYHQHQTMQPQQPTQIPPYPYPNATVPTITNSLTKSRKPRSRQSEQSKPRRKHDRFNGVPEEEVLKLVLPDHLRLNLDILIVGINPGLFAAYKGHHYAGPGNHFWKCLYLAGLVPDQLTAMDDHRLPEFGIGVTNMVQRTSKGSSDLTRNEIKEGTKDLIEKIKKYKPLVCIFNGKCIFEAFCGIWFEDIKKFEFGLQKRCIPGTNTLIYVMPSSSARCSQFPRATDKVPFYEKVKDAILLIKQGQSCESIIDQSDEFNKSIQGLGHNYSRIQKKSDSKPPNDESSSPLSNPTPVTGRMQESLNNLHPQTNQVYQTQCTQGATLPQTTPSQHHYQHYPVVQNTPNQYPQQPMPPPSPHYGANPSPPQHMWKYQQAPPTPKQEPDELPCLGPDQLTPLNAMPATGTYLPAEYNSNYPTSSYYNAAPVNYQTYAPSHPQNMSSPGLNHTAPYSPSPYSYQVVSGGPIPNAMEAKLENTHNGMRCLKPADF